MNDVPKLCEQLAVLRRALAAASTPARLDDPATPHPTVAAVLVPTPPPAEGRRVPSSRPPIDLTLLETAKGLDAALVGLAADLRRTLGHTTVDAGPVKALDAISTHHRYLTEGCALERRIAGVLTGWVARCKRVLQIDEQWLELGPCPEIHQDAIPVAWDEQGSAVAYVEVRECVFYDQPASYAATLRRGAPVDIWRRSHLRAPLGADLATAVVECPGCGRTWAPADRATLVVTVTDRERTPV